MEYRHLPRMIKYEDIITFRKPNSYYKYQVRNTHLYEQIGAPNDTILYIAIGRRVGEKKLYEICSTFYGYEHQGGGRPHYKENDFEAASNLVDWIVGRLLEKRWKVELNGTLLLKKQKWHL